MTNRSRRDGASDVFELVGDYTNPILKPQAAETVKRHGEISLTRVPYPTPSNQCWPGGVPFVLFNIGMQMLEQPDKITILYSNDHEVRHVRLNQSHPANVTPSWYGKNAARRGFPASGEIPVWHAIRTTRARDCSSTSPSRMTASSRSPGRPP